MRGLLGVGAALVMPATLSTITSTFPPEQRTRAVGAWAGVAGASAILGLLMSGLLLEVVVVAVGVRPERRAGRGGDHRCRTLHPGVRGARRTPTRPCRGGAHRRGPGSTRLLGDRGAYPRLGQRATLGGHRDRTADPRRVRPVGAVPTEPPDRPSVVPHRAFTAASLSITVQFFAFFGLVFLLLQYLQLVRGNTPLVAALSLIPMALALMPSARGIAPRLSEPHRSDAGLRPRPRADQRCAGRAVATGWGELVLAAADRVWFRSAPDGPGHDAGDCGDHRCPAGRPSKVWDPR